jgi:hypothetical protein
MNGVNYLSLKLLGDSEDVISFDPHHVMVLRLICSFYYLQHSTKLYSIGTGVASRTNNSLKKRQLSSKAEEKTFP